MLSIGNWRRFPKESVFCLCINNFLYGVTQMKTLKKILNSTLFLTTTFLLTAASPDMAWVADVTAVDTGDTTFILVSAAMVLLMTLGLALFYGGMVRKNIPMVVLGAGLLWFGWFGFNAGSALGANGIAVAAFVTTNTATAGAALAWLIAEWMHHGKPTV